MSDSFNGYHVWLGIPPGEQPPNHYRLLGIAPFETEMDVIDHAADRQMAHVRTFQSGRHAALSQQMLNELATARLCLLNAERKAVYDRQLRAELAAKSVAVPMGKALPVAKPAVAVVPRSAPIHKSADVDDDAYEVESSDLAPLASRVLDDEDAFALADSPSVPAIQLGAPPRLVDRDATLQRSMVYLFGLVAIIVVFLLLYGFLQQLVGPINLREMFSSPASSAPSDPAAEAPAPAPQPAPVPPPPSTAPDS